ncbi:DUF3572 domain-containing protein [Planktotalea sp.]|uniref:DUF3572 domain-containing protein n=1 Tax=Planktotalea sp. TaxID=2029877 RepID=UPI0025DA4EAC|nr:DUF3572 domain-containing protein [Planktotalea sp.]
MALSKEAAEVFSINALGWIVGQEDVLPAFLGASGSSEEDIRLRVGDSEFLLSVLDFLMMDDQWVISCCDALQVPYERVHEARQSMPGGAEMNWT